MGALEATFQVLTIISSMFVRVAPWPDFRRVYRAKSTGEVQILPVVMLFTNCVVLVWYGYLSEDIFPLFVTAIMGLITCGGFIAVFYRFTDDKPTVHRICAAAFAVIVLVCLYGAIGVAGVTGQSKSSLATAMGATSIGTSIGLYGSPLATIRRVIRNKSTASMPFTLCLANFFNSVCWVIYAVITVDLWVLLPNAFGCVLTTIQLILYAIYPTSKSNESAMIDHPGAITDYEREASLSVIVTSNTQESERLARKGSLNLPKDTLDYVAIRSPVARQLSSRIARPPRRDCSEVVMDRFASLLKFAMAGTNQSLIIVCASSSTVQDLIDHKDMSAAQSVFQVLSIVTAVFVRFSPFPDFRRIHTAKKVGEVQVLPVVTLFTNCVVLVWYGYLSDDIFPLLATAVLGLITCSGFTFVFYYYTDDRRAVHRILLRALLFIVLVCAYGTLGVCGLTGQSDDSVGTAFGAISIVTSVVLCGSPLATIRRVVRAKSTASMPFTLSLANFTNGAVWIVYSVMIKDIWVFIPNVMGFVLSSIQMAVYAIYPSSSGSDLQPETAVVYPASDDEASLSIILATPGKDKLDRKDSLDFIAIRSPSTRCLSSVSIDRQ
ncbi:MtN3-like protein [Phytophthora cinnamomi]|uniref:MtN3-like protein n=1 Tax=Phytophthora cinnamomi TaxID=4785 RepID=UPI003559A727|nr:MtN3-like protein [Phytophthora cinnamomi]